MLFALSSNNQYLWCVNCSCSLAVPCCVVRRSCSTGLFWTFFAVWSDAMVFFCCLSSQCWITLGFFLSLYSFSAFFKFICLSDRMNKWSTPCSSCVWVLSYVNYLTHHCSLTCSPYYLPEARGKHPDSQIAEMLPHIWHNWHELH